MFEILKEIDAPSLDKNSDLDKIRAEYLYRNYIRQDIKHIQSRRNEEKKNLDEANQSKKTA